MQIMDVGRVLRGISEDFREWCLEKSYRFLENPEWIYRKYFVKINGGNLWGKPWRINEISGGTLEGNFWEIPKVILAGYFKVFLKKSWRCSRNHRRNLLKSPLTFFEKFWKETKEILYIFQKKRSKMVKTEKFSENCIKDSMEVMDIRRILWEISEDLRE